MFFNDDGSQMEHDSQRKKPAHTSEKKDGVWSPVALKVISILGCYLAVVVFYIINYIRLEHPKASDRVKTLTVIAMAYILLFIAVGRNFYYLPLFYIANIILGIVISNDQTGLYETYISNGGRKYSSAVLPFLAIGSFLAIWLVVVTLMTIFQLLFTGVGI